MTDTSMATTVTAEMGEERSGVTTMHGNPLTLVGRELKVGDLAPDVALVGGDMKPVKPLGMAGQKAKLVVTVPSVDTPVCSIETKKFNEAVAHLGDKVAAYTISADLPFAQSRWCGAEGVKNLTLLSDYRDMPLGRSWGLYIKEMGLLARAVYVIDKNNTVVYREIVGEIAAEPDYDAALAAIKAAS